MPGVNMRRVIGAIGVSAPIFAAATVVVGGFVTTGYDPLTRTISRLAEPGLPAAGVVDAIVGRALLAIAGAGLLIAAAVHLDPASATTTAVHRTASGFVMVALMCAPFALGRPLGRRGWRRYARLSFAIGGAEARMLVIAMPLLLASFSDWGAWERVFLALPIAWVVLVSARLLRASSTDPRFSSTAERKSWATTVSADETMNANAASASSTGE
jgi:hypothetical protein